MSCNNLATRLKKPSRLPPPLPKNDGKPKTPSSCYYSGTPQGSCRDIDTYSEGLASVSSHAYTAPFQGSTFTNYAASECNSDYMGGTRSECYATSSCCPCRRCYLNACAPAPMFCHMVSSSRQPARALPLPPVPQQRRNRPKLSISPLPELKRNVDGRESKSRIKYGPLDYKRFIELHIKRMSKYFDERQMRFEKFEKDYIRINNIQVNAIQRESPSYRQLRKLLIAKETRYLRSLRAKYGPKDFKELKGLGSGYIGHVWLVEKVNSIRQDHEPPELYAMKKLKKSQVFREGHMAHIMAERDMLAEADNEWIVKLFYSFQDDYHLYFILEYIPGGDLMNALQKKNVFPEEWARFYVAEIALALQYVHDKKFIHRDIKPDNILIDHRGHIKLTDFGLCTGFRWTHDKNFYVEDLNGNRNTANVFPINQEHPTITQGLQQRDLLYSERQKTISVVGSPNYIAPEVLEQRLQNGHNIRLCDWWSVGVILYEMIIGYCPFINWPELRKEYRPELDKPEFIQMRIVNWRHHLAFPKPNDIKSPPCLRGTKWPEDPEALSEPFFISEEAESLIKGWICDPADRLCQNGIRDILQHPFFAGIDWNNIRLGPAPFEPKLSHAGDTRHFESYGHYPDNDGTLGGPSPAHGMHMNDFTHIDFWSKPKR